MLWLFLVVLLFLVLVFLFDDVIDKVRVLVDEFYQVLMLIFVFFCEFIYEQYQGICFKLENSFWIKSNVCFQVMLMLLGLYFKYLVVIYEVDVEGVCLIIYNKVDYNYINEELVKCIFVDLGYGGFKLIYLLQGLDSCNQFLVFVGVSYFCVVGWDNSFGLLVRGVVVNIGLFFGEQFFLFMEFWLV